MCRSQIAVWIAAACLSGVLASCATEGNDTQKTSEGPAPAFPAPPLPTPAPKDSVLPAEDGLRAYAAILGGLEALVERGRRETRSMGEPRQRAASESGFSALETIAMEDALDEWTDDLVLIEGNLPEKPAPQENAALSLVHTNLSRAIGELRRVPFVVSGGRTPTIPEREKRFDAAEQYLRRARQALESARR